MLHLILGPSGSGKSHRILSEIKARAEAGEYSILIVPEQFTSTTEQRLYNMLGDRLSAFVESYSFTSLSEAILNRYGGAGTPTLTDAGRAVLLRRALADLGDSVRYYKKQSRSPMFCSLAGETVNELKNAGITAEKLSELAAHAAYGREKLSELALIYAAYEKRLKDTALDPTDRVELAAKRVQPDFFAGKAVYLDEFDTFNASKRSMLAAVLPVSDVTAGICCDDTPQEQGGLFYGAVQVCARLRRLGQQAAVPVRQTVLEQDYRHKTPALRAVTRLLAGSEPAAADAGEGEGVTLFEAAGRREEAAAAAAQVLRLHREGMPFSAMAIICRETEEYLSALRYQFRLAGVPLYWDGAAAMAETAPARAAMAALELLRGGLTGANMLALMRTGLCALSEEERQALEQYVYTWEPSAGQWEVPFTGTPEGYGDQVFPSTEQELALAESARQKLAGPALAFCRECRGATARTVTHGLYAFLEKIGARRQNGRTTHQLQVLAARLRAEEGTAEAERLIQQWNKLMELLDETEKLLGDEQLSAAQYAEHFELLLRCSDLGTIPQTAESVMLTGAGRMRLDGVRAAFVLGLAEGEFPRTPGTQGLLTNADRDALFEADSLLVQKGDTEPIELPDCFENKLVREKICFYHALTVAGERLWLSWPGGRGETPPCAALDELTAALHPQPPQLTQEDMAATRAMAAQAMGQAMHAGGAVFGSLHRALGMDTAAMAMAVDGVCGTLADKHAVAQVLGDTLTLSPSRVEQFYRCPFSYGMNYLLRVRPRKKARLTADQGGNLIHWVLEQVVRQYAARWQEFLQLPPVRLDTLAADLTGQYAAQYLPGITDRPEQSWQLARMRQNLSQLLARLQNEFIQTDCRPVACELEIGPGEGKVPPLTWQDGDGHTVRLVGKVDRVDLLEQGGVSYVRVVDYKTGDKRIDLDEVNSGVDCQMLYYLTALQQQGFRTLDGRQVEHPAPAGVLYLLVDPRPDEKGRRYETKGLLLHDMELLSAMEADGSGAFLPVSCKTDKSLDKRSMANVLPEQGFAAIAARLGELVRGMARELYEGRLDACPLQDRYGKAIPCQYCDYRQLCGHVPGTGERQLTPHHFPVAEGQ